MTHGLIMNESMQYQIMMRAGSKESYCSGLIREVLFSSTNGRASKSESSTRVGISHRRWHPELPLVMHVAWDSSGVTFLMLLNCRNFWGDKAGSMNSTYFNTLAFGNTFSSYKLIMHAISYNYIFGYSQSLSGVFLLGVFLSRFSPHLSLYVETQSYAGCLALFHSARVLL